MTTALAQRLAKRLDREHAVLTGHGSTAIYLALRAIARERGTGEVIVPAIGCASIAQIVIYAGFTPRYADIRLEDFTIDLDSLRAEIGPDTRAILPVHLYGHAADMHAVGELARAHDVVVIEDAAQSLGGRLGAAPLGSFGQFSIVSFGGTKAVSAGGGGALLFDDDRFLEDVERDLAALPPFETSPATRYGATSHWKLYHGAIDYLRIHPEAQMEWVFASATPLFRDLYLHRFPESLAPSIDAGLDALDESSEHRQRRAERYHAQLADLPIRRSDAWRQSGSIWRYTFLLPDADDATRISDALRASGVNASNHYWSLADIFAGRKDLPNAACFSPRVVNFWVDDSATDEAIDRACTRLRELLSGR